MGFSIEWEKTYQTGAHNSVWPWSEVVSLTNRYFKGDKSGLRVLELGCGAGANIPFFAAISAEYCGIEGSITEVMKLQERYECPCNTDKCAGGGGATVSQLFWQETLLSACPLRENLI